MHGLESGSDCRQSKKQGPLWKLAMDKECDGVTCSARTSLQVQLFTTPHLQDLRDLLMTLSATKMFINRGLLLCSIPTIS